MRVQHETVHSYDLYLHYVGHSANVPELCSINGQCPQPKDRGGTVVKVLCYKSEGRWFDPSWCHWNFSLT